MGVYGPGGPNGPKRGQNRPEGDQKAREVRESFEKKIAGALVCGGLEGVSYFAWAPDPALFSPPHAG